MSGSKSVERPMRTLPRELEVIEPFSYNTFKPRTTLAELAKRFEQGYIPKRKKRSNVVQLDMFDKL